MPRVTFQRPRRIEWEELTPVFGRLVAEPFEKGYALTVGNSLRRVLLSAIPGAAIAWATVDGVARGSDRVAGIEEDLTTLLLGLKKVTVRLVENGGAIARLDVSGPGLATAGDFRGVGFEVLNRDLTLATLQAGARLVLEAGIQSGRTYVSAERHKEAPPPGAIALDAAFSPIRRVNYTVEMSRLGNITDYEKLVFEIGTNGAITPDDAVLRAATMLREHFDFFTPAGAEEEDEEPPVERAEATTSS